MGINLTNRLSLKLDSTTSLEVPIQTSAYNL